MTSRYLAFIPLSITMFIMGSCNPNGAEYVDELDLVLTVQDKDLNYNNFTTYVLADTIMYLGSQEGDELSSKQAEFLLDEVKSRFDEAGWVQSIDPATNGSDVLLTVSVIENVNISVVGGWWDYWGGYYGWGYYPGYPAGGWYPYYPGYPGYCCYTSIYAYAEGTLIIEMLDPNNGEVENDNDADPLPVLWAGAVNGLLSGSQSDINSRIGKGLNQMFDDSPYLYKN